MVKFKIEKGLSPSKRGPRAKYTDYEELFKMLPKMRPGDSIKIVEVPQSRRNSSYNAINGVLQKQFSQLSGIFYISSSKLDKMVEDDRGRQQPAIEIRVYRDIDAPKKKGK